MHAHEHVDHSLRAYEIAHGMTDAERIALGAAIIETVIDPRLHHAVRSAGSHIAEHADALLDMQLDIEIEASDSRAPSTGPAVWDRIAHAERRLSESWAGDMIGAVCVVFLAGTATVLLPLLFGH